MSAARRFLVVGQTADHVRQTLARAVPGAHVAAADNAFDGIAELHAGNFDAVLADADDAGDRHDAAADALRDVAGDAPIFAYSQNNGVAPRPADLVEQLADGPPAIRDEPAGGWLGRLLEAATPALVLDAQLARPGKALHEAVAKLADAAGVTLELLPEADSSARSRPVGDAAAVRLDAKGAADGEVGRALDAIAPLLERLAKLDARHLQTQRLAYVDDLTGLYNGRFFRQYLGRILDHARRQYFPVTLLLFDIDNFKQYNDQFGHGVGDEILRQTARLIRRCCRDHDLVARVSGDEFAVVFWEKEGPRQPRDPSGATTARLPQTPLQIANRFRRLMDRAEFHALGQSGRGKLTISGGMAVFPYDAPTAEELITAADRALMFDAKQHGKNTIALVTGHHAPDDAADDE